MTLITSRVLDDDGSGIPGVYVRARLLGSPWLAGHTAQVDAEADDWTDADGRWTLDLTPLSALEDHGAYWRVRVFQRGELDVAPPPAPAGNLPVEVGTPGVLLSVPPPADPPPAYIPQELLGRPGGVATLGEDGVLEEKQRPADSIQRWHHGHGPPPLVIEGAAPGDMYVDDDAHVLYQLD